MKRKLLSIITIIVIILVMCSCAAPSEDISDGGDKETMLESALTDGNYQGVVDIVELDSKYASVEIDDSTPLNWAAYNGNVDLCKYLLGKGAKPEGGILVNVENLDVINLLIENGADVNAKVDGKNALEELIAPVDIFTESDDGQRVDLLLEKGATIGQETLEYIIKRATDCSRVQNLLCENGYGDKLEDTLVKAILGDSEALMKIDSVCKESGTVAQYAAAFCNLDAVKHLEEIGYDFSVTDDMGCNGTAALAAEYNKDNKVAEYLLKKYGSESAVTNIDYSLSLYGIAVTAGNFDMADKLKKEYKEIWAACTAAGAEGSMEYLIKNGYRPSAKEVRQAFVNGNRSCIEYMISSKEYIEMLKNSSVAVQDEALYNAGSKKYEWYEELFKAGVKPGSNSFEIIMTGRNLDLAKQIADKYEDSDIIYDEYVAAINYGYMEVIEYITEKGIDLNRTIHDEEMEPAEFNLIHMAAQCPSATILQYLIDNGADVNAEDKDGETAAVWAEYAECPMNIEILKNSSKKNG